MNSHPSFIYDQYRPGIETVNEAEVWKQKREELEGIIHGSAEKIGATIVKGLGGAEDERTKGVATVVYLARTEPPMTTEEAHTFGNAVVADWTDATLTERPPEFCDTVFELPMQA